VSLTFLTVKRQSEEDKIQGCSWGGRGGVGLQRKKSKKGHEVMRGGVRKGRKVNWEKRETGIQGGGKALGKKATGLKR